MLAFTVVQKRADGIGLPIMFLLRGLVILIATLKVKAAELKYSQTQSYFKSMQVLGGKSSIYVLLLQKIVFIYIHTRYPQP